MRTSLLATLAAALIGCGACGPRPPATQAPPVRTATAEPDAPMGPGEGRALAEAVLAAHARMHQRFSAAAAIHTALALADLPRAQAEAARVAALDEPEALPVWRPFVDDIRAAARELGAAPDPVIASHALARIGRGCARCHVAMGARIAFAAEPRPEPTPRLTATMAGHHWGAARMLEGLIGPSTSRWLEGAAALEGAPLAITAEARTPGHDLGIADDVAEIRALARRARDVDELDARARLYGDLVATCVRCHAAIRDR